MTAPGSSMGYIQMLGQVDGRVFQLAFPYVSLDTIRNWEQGKRSPTGAARALLRVLDKAPEASLMALG